MNGFNFINETLNKNLIENLLKILIKRYNNTSNIKLLDNLKTTGYKYATKQGLSISIFDLKNFRKKKYYIQNAKYGTELIRKQEKLLKNIELSNYTTVLNIWNQTNNLLRNSILTFFKNKEIYNTLFLMSNSGARGTIDQIYQLIGMRGLMSDKQGFLLDTPILNSLKEGLNIVEFFFTSFGARKGILDTALMTADAGYLTRRLVEAAFNVVIRDIKCKTKKSITANTKSTLKHLEIIGRQSHNIVKFKNLLLHKTLITEHCCKELIAGFKINIKSPITCSSLFSICQNCFGFDFNQRKKINLGTTIGVASAQNIGETGTQMTMRTFHTGGIGGEKIRIIKPSFSGFISLKKEKLVLQNWNNNRQIIELQNNETVEKKNAFIHKNKDLIISEKPKEKMKLAINFLGIFAPISGHFSSKKIRNKLFLNFIEFNNYYREKKINDFILTNVNKKYILNKRKQTKKIEKKIKPQLKISLLNIKVTDKIKLSIISKILIEMNLSQNDKTILVV